MRRRQRSSAFQPGAAHTAEVEAERRGWYEFVDLIRSLTPDECLEPGYYRGPDWSVRDVVAHLGTRLAEAGVQFQRIRAGTYEGHDIDFEALNVELLDAMSGQPWYVAWVQANASRSRMIDEWYELRDPSEEAAWWIRKSGGDHFSEHLGRLREWVAELVSRRSVEQEAAQLGGITDGDSEVSGPPSSSSPRRRAKRTP
jgi:hypothetical protein